MDVKKVALLLLTCCLLAGTAAAAAPLPNHEVSLPRRTSVENLTQTSDIIAYGRFDTAHESKALRKRIGDSMLVNYKQNFHVLKYLKGSGPAVVKVVSTGIEPMPDPDEEWNAVYPGPMTEGNYVCFLTRLDSAYFAINGRWQGVYPVHDRKTIALEGAGFPEFGNLTVQQLEAKVLTAR